MIAENYGINSDDLEKIVRLLSKNGKVKELILFGSRAKGNYKKGSDIDLAIIGNDFSYNELVEMRLELDDLMLPYTIDIIDINKITNKELLEHISRVGKTIRISESDLNTL